MVNMTSFVDDLRYALRAIIRRPVFAGAAILTFALGIGASTAVFRVIYGVLLEPPPLNEPDRIVTIWEESTRRPGVHNVASPANYLRWIERATSFSTLTAYVDARANLNEAQEPEEVVVQRVTPGFFEVLGVAPLAGRLFSDTESRDPQANVVVLGYPLWQRRFGADSSIIGRVFNFNGAPTTVVGVMPQGFTLYLRSGGLAGKPAELWAPYVLAANARETGSRSLTVLGRLTPNATVASARAEMETIAAGLATEFPERDAGWTARVVPVQEAISGAYRRPLLLIGGAVMFVMLIACANVANLLLARNAGRQSELAMRAALGAGRGRIVQLLFAESVTLAFLGGIASLLVSRLTLALLIAINPMDYGPAIDVRTTTSVLVLTAFVAALTALIAGIVPAVAYAGSGLFDVIKGGAHMVGRQRQHRRSLHVVVVAELALCMALLTGAGLLVRSLRALQAVDVGFDTSNLLTFRMQLPRAKYTDDSSRVRFFQEAEARLAHLPGVQSAGIVSFLPLSGSTARSNLILGGRPPAPAGQEPFFDISVCDNGYLRAFGVRLIKGRWFSDLEQREKSNVAMISESFARTYFPDEDPIGQRVSVTFTQPVVPTEIVGVVSDFRSHDLSTIPVPTLFWPHPQLAYSTMTVAIRSAIYPALLVKTVEREVRSIDKEQPVSDVRTMDQWISRRLAQSRFNTVLLTGFSSLALLLAAVGVYGVVSFVVGQRRAEIGLRLALGANPREIVGLVVFGVLRLASVGIAIGGVLALALGRTFGNLLYRTPAVDPLTLAAVAAVLGIVAFLASIVPAARAARISPTQTLRES